MSSFTDCLQVEFLSGRTWRTSRAFSYWTDCDDALPESFGLASRCTTVLSVPAGFVTDFASIPRALWPVIGHPAGPYVQAAVLHDCLYREPGMFVTRAKADAIFLEAMEVLGVSWWRRRAMWAAVRAFGGAAWEERK